MLGAVGTGQSPAPTLESTGGLDWVGTLLTTLFLQHIGQSLRARNPLESIQTHSRMFDLNAGKYFNPWAERDKRDLNQALTGCVSLGQTPNIEHR